jgi:hypothetical protein
MLTNTTYRKIIDPKNKDKDKTYEQESIIDTLFFCENKSRNVIYSEIHFLEYTLNNIKNDYFMINLIKELIKEKTYIHKNT